MTNRKHPWAMLALVSAAVITWSGCSTPPTITSAPANDPALAGSRVIVKTVTSKMAVTSIDASQRTVVLRRPNGTTFTCKAGPQVVNFNELQPGDVVEATIVDKSGIFLLKNGPVPSAGAGISVDEASPGTQPGRMVLATQDANARVTSYDRSYRLLVVEYADGQTRSIKLPLHTELESVKRGDDVVVRTAEPMAVRLEKS
jgi:hypothetical protein